MFELVRALGRLLAMDASLHFKDVAIVLELGTGYVQAQQRAQPQQQPFELYLVKDWLARRNLPSDWFFPGTEVYEDNLTAFLRQLQSVREMLSDEMFLIVAIDQNGSNVMRLTISHPTADLEMSEADIRATARMSDGEYAMRFMAIRARC